jgi:hypothetical protein
MAKASINIQVASGNSEKHMDRESKTTYLLDPDSKKNEYKTFKSSKDFLSAAKVAAKEKTGRSMQKLAEKNFVQEAVLNLEENHTLDDVKKVFDNLKQEFGGFEVFKIAVHKDEGYFYHKKEELEYRPNRDIFFNEKDKKFYLDKNHTKEADLNQFEKRYNYHAHVLFTKFDMTKGKNARLNRSDMRKVQTITAKTLGMERGQEFSKAKRKSHWQLKEAHDIKRDTKKELLAKQKDLDKLKKEIRAEMVAEGGYTKEDYQALNKQFKSLQEQVKAKDLTISDLKKEVNSWKHEAMNWQEAKSYKELYENTKKENLELEEQNKALEAKISVNPTPSTPNTSKSDLNGNFEELYANLKDHSRDWESARTEKMFLESSISRTLDKDIDQLVDKHITQREIKTKLGFVSEFLDVVDKKALKEEIKELQKEHKSNYAKFDKFLELFSKPAHAVMKKVQEVQSKIFMQKAKQKNQNKGMKI